MLNMYVDYFLCFGYNDAGWTFDAIKVDDFSGPLDDYSGQVEMHVCDDLTSLEIKHFFADNSQYKNEWYGKIKDMTYDGDIDTGFGTAKHYTLLVEKDGGEREQEMCILKNNGKYVLFVVTLYEGKSAGDKLANFFK